MHARTMSTPLGDYEEGRESLQACQGRQIARAVFGRLRRLQEVAYQRATCGLSGRAKGRAPPSRRGAHSYSSAGKAVTPAVALIAACVASHAPRGSRRSRRSRRFMSMARERLLGGAKKRQPPLVRASSPTSPAFDQAAFDQAASVQASECTFVHVACASLSFSRTQRVAQWPCTAAQSLLQRRDLRLTAASHSCG